MIRVVHVSFGIDIGGQEKLQVELARHADRSRFALTFVSLGSRGALADDLESQGWDVIALGKGRGLKPSLAYDLARLFRRIRPDVVHTHDNRALFYAVPAARLVRVSRLIHTRHGRNVDATARQTAVGSRLSRLVDAYVCVSADVSDQCLGEGISRRSLTTITNGIDLKRFAFSGPQPGGPIVAVARLSPEKDMANLVRAMAIVVRSEPSVCVEVAGDGPCLHELRRLVSELGLEGRVFLLGAVRDIPGLMARGSLFVLPSRSEGIPPDFVGGDGSRTARSGHQRWRHTRGRHRRRDRIARTGRRSSVTRGCNPASRGRPRIRSTDGPGGEGARGTIIRR